MHSVATKLEKVFTVLRSYQTHKIVYPEMI